MSLTGNIKNGDWESVRKAIAYLGTQSLGPNSTPTFAGITVSTITSTSIVISSLTASRLVASDASKNIISTDLYSWVTGTTNQIIVTDDTDGTITLSIPQDIHTGASPTFTGLDLTGITDTNIPYMSASGFANSPIYFDGIGVGIGGTTDYTTIEADGTVVFNGAATVWKDINLGAAQVLSPSSAYPDIDEFKDENGDDVGVETLAFNTGEGISGAFEMQHDYKEGSNFQFHVHWQGIAAPTGTDKVQWQLEYTVAQNGTTLNAPTTIVIETDFDTQYEFTRSDFPVINGAGIGIGDQFLFKLSRIAATIDEYGGDALMATCGIHYEVDMVGSRTLESK